MANRTNNRRGSWKVAALGAALGASVLGAVLMTSALAVNDPPFPFELDGNVTDPVGGQDDWQGVFGLGGVVPPATLTPPGVNGAEVFIRDLALGSSKETQYDAGKDTLNLSGWTRKDVSKVVPDKDNITDAFAKQYMVDHDGNAGTPEHRVIYFGADRFANNGDAALGFWFFQQEVQLTGTNGFSPNHTARNNATGQRGDILIQADFVSGGKSSEIQVFEWVGSGGSHGPLNELEFAASNGTIVCTSDDSACAVTNNAATGSYWPYVPKAGSSGTFPAESFYEGGIDITALVGDVCFNTFLANTRTSHSETADLKDLALGDFNTCGSIDLVRKECQAAEGVSPVYDPTTELFQTKHVLTIRNDGLGGVVHDVSIRDDAVDADNVCNIIAISGGTGNPVVGTGIPIPNNSTYIKVAETLGAGIPNQMTVTLLCQSPLNGFANTASIRAGQSDGGTNLTDSYAETGSDVTPQCVVESAPGLDVTKSCENVTLDPTNDFKPLVCANFSITNTSAPAQRLAITKFLDTRQDGTTNDLIDNIPLVLGKRVLNPGQTINVLNECYTPAAPDSDQTDPDLARYSDQVAATGEGFIGGITQEETAAATCDLCPTGLDGSP
jgi:hypothetical protein